MVVRRSPKPLMGVRSSLPLLQSVSFAGNAFFVIISLCLEVLMERRVLHDYIISLGGSEELWNRIEACEGVYKELEYWCTNGNLLGEYNPHGISISDCIAWQVDHFKAYMDREENNRWHRERLFIQSLETLLDISDGSEEVLRKITGENGESGTDREDV